MNVTVYGVGGNRSARCHWTLAEAEVVYQTVERPGLIGSDELRAFHPLAKVPAAVIDGQALFESAAICTYIADQVPEAELIAPPGTWERALHDQWVSYGQSELEAWLWNTAVNTFVLPPEKRIDAGFAQNQSMFKRGVRAIEAHLAVHPYLVQDRFTVTDIIVGWTLNWGRRQGLLGDFPATMAYVQRLLERPTCALSKD